MQTYQSWLQRVGTYLVVLLLFGFSAGIGGIAVITFQVIFGDDSVLQRSTFLAQMNEETIILTSDEQTRLGSFFDSIHRRYIPIEEVPIHLINAFIASEDKNYYSHMGVDPIAIFLAFSDGIVRGGFHRGASTITQQTVKNILDRREHSFRRKFREWVRALQLERLYDKKQIMEFYLNQFHVAHNGNGVGIAARYYFDKDVRDLTLAEAAFIAGSVKAPSKYNPFIKDTPERKEKAWQHANERKNYVLRQMWIQDLVNKDELEEAWKQPVPFSKGKFQSKEVALVSLIRGQLKRQEILDAIGLENLSDLNTAGLKVFTTLDIDFQTSAQLAMRRNLSRLETILKGFESEPLDKFKPVRELETNQFYFGKVVKVNSRAKQPSIELDFGLPKAVIPYDSIRRYAKMLDVAQSIGIERRIRRLLGKVKPGDILFVEAREYDKVAHTGVVEFQKMPEISGGLIVLDKGEVRAMVSGFNPEGYNRAIFATRQPGSVFKSVVYYAGMQLGWSMLDQLDNERRVFPYQGQFYYPQPDHNSPYSNVSLIWAGAKSENLGSVYLTANLLQKLNFDQFKALMGQMGLLPEEGELPRDFHYRVAKTVGVQLENQGIREHELSNAVKAMAPDLIFRRQEKVLGNLKKMWWGRGYLAELQSLYQLDPETHSDAEQWKRIELIKNNFERHKLLMANATEDWSFLEGRIQELGPDRAYINQEVRAVFDRFRVVSSRSGRPQLAYFKILPGEELPADLVREMSLEPRVGRSLNALDVQAIWGGNSIFGAQANISLVDVRLEGYIPVGMLSDVEQGLEKRVSSVLSVNDQFDLIRYFRHHDFRIALGLNYLVKLSKAMGVHSKLEPVLSFPLGTNVVSVASVAKIYQTFAKGMTYRFYKEGTDNQLNFIRRIEDRFGNILFEPMKVEHQLADPSYSVQMQQILRKVVTHGTGRMARGELYINVGKGGGSDAAKVTEVPIKIPSFGKTGTTNDYRTASFAGFVPYPTTKNRPLDPRDSYVIASYVGYDLNSQMRRGAYKVSGAVGALPAWVDMAKSIFEINKYDEFVDRFDINLMSKREWSMKFPEKSQAVKVDLARGLILRRAEGNDFEQFPTTNRYRSGELNINEFDLDASAQSVVRVPTVLGNAENSLHFVSLFVPEAKPGEAQKELERSQVELLDGVSTMDSAVPPQPINSREDGAQNVQPRNPRLPDGGAAQSTAEIRRDGKLKNNSLSNQRLEESAEQSSPPDRAEGSSEEAEDEDAYLDEELW
jgi:penicillin-binding protein 1A